MESAAVQPSGPDGPEPSPELRAQAEQAASRLNDLSRRDFAVIVPAFDEAPVIAELIRELRAGFERYGLAGVQLEKVCELK